MKVALSTFTRSGLETHLGADLPAGVQAALRDYARRLKSGPAPLAPPRFFGRAVPSAGDDLELTIDPETQALLELEAARQGTTIGELAVHTVIAYLAELDLNRY